MSKKTVQLLLVVLALSGIWQPAIAAANDYDDDDVDDAEDADDGDFESNEDILARIVEIIFDPFQALYEEFMGDLRFVVDNQLNAFLKTMDDFETLLRDEVQQLDANDSRKLLLKPVLKFLQLFNSNLKQFAQQLQAGRDNADAYLQQQNQNLINGLSVWSKAQLSRVKIESDSAQQALKNASALLDAFNEHFQQRLSECERSITQLSGQHELLVNEFLNNTAQQLVQLLNDAQRCLGPNFSLPICAANLGKLLQNSQGLLRNLSDILAVNSQWVQLELKNFKCIADVSSRYEAKKNDIAAAIGEIIKAAAAVADEDKNIVKRQAVAGQNDNSSGQSREQRDDAAKQATGSPNDSSQSEADSQQNNGRHKRQAAANTDDNSSSDTDDDNDDDEDIENTWLDPIFMIDPKLGLDKVKPSSKSQSIENA